MRHSNFELTDHKNRDKLDNCRSNLRPATYLQNSGNQKTGYGSSKFKGVSWYKVTEKWLSQIQFEGKTKHLGYFTDELDAAKAYNEAALKHFGEFARLNVID